MKRCGVPCCVQIVAVLVLAALVLVACQPKAPAGRDTPLPSSLPVSSATHGEPPGTTSAPLTGTKTPEKPLSDVLPTDPDARQVTALAVADLSLQLSVPEESILVRSVEPIQWPDASLGCPQPGTMYALVITPGYLIALEAEGTRYEYHTDQDQHVVLCALARRLTPVASAPAQVAEEVGVPTAPTIPTPESAALQKLVAEAKEHLAQRLLIPAAQIDLVELSPVVWPDGALGCPEPGVAYTQVQQEGLLIRLRAGKQIYPYHSGGGTPPFLCEQAIEDAKPQ